MPEQIAGRLHKQCAIVLQIGSFPTYLMTMESSISSTPALGSAEKTGGMDSNTEALTTANSLISPSSVGDALRLLFVRALAGLDVSPGVDGPSSTFRCFRFSFLDFLDGPSGVEMSAFLFFEASRGVAVAVNDVEGVCSIVVCPMKTKASDEQSSKFPDRIEM